MNLLHPALAVAGLAAVAIPIIIHLLMHRRRKPVMWGAMRFLLEAYKRQRRRLMLEKWLLLAARCLLLALLGLAIGRPLLGALGASGGGGKTVYILLDNGLASSVRGDDGQTALERHKAAAKSVLAALRGSAEGGGREGDRVAIISLGAPAEGLVIPASSDLGAVAAILDEIESADSRTDLAGGIALVAGAIEGSPGPNAAAASPLAPEPRDEGSSLVVLLSDFLEGSADVSEAGGVAASGDGRNGAGLGGVRLPPGVALLATRPAAAGRPNISIVGVEPLRPVLIAGAGSASGGNGGPTGRIENQVRIALRRSGDDLSSSQVTTVRATIGNGETGDASMAPASPSSRAVVRWTPGQDAAVVALNVGSSFSNEAASGASGEGGSATTSHGGAAVIAAMIDNDALAPDNTWRRPIEVRQALRAGVIAPTRFARTERADRLDPGAWARLALAPLGEGGGVEVVDIEPASLDAARLAGLDAVFLPRPDLVAESGWARIRVFVEGGGLVIVSPPPGVTVHLWGDAMCSTLGLPWTLAREARSLSPDQGTLRAPAGVGNTGLDSLLTLLGGEIEPLVRPVSVFKVLPIVPGEATGAGAGAEGRADAGGALLELSDATDFVWAGPIADGPLMAAGSNADPSGSGGRGLVVYIAAALDLEWTNLPAKPLMVPLVQELLRQGVGEARGSWWTVAGVRPPVPRRTTELARIASVAEASGGETSAAGDDRIVTDPSGFTGSPIRHGGLWRAIDERGGARGLVAVNADPRGGRTAAQTQDAVGAWLGAAVTKPSGGEGSGVIWLPPSGEAGVAPQIGAAPAAGGLEAALAAYFGSTDEGSPISLPILIAVLALAVVEIILARRASHAELPSAPASSPLANLMSNLGQSPREAA